MKKKNEEPIRKNRRNSIIADLYLHGTSIKLKIIATPEDWIKLAKHMHKRENYRIKTGINYFSSDFYGSFVSPVLEKYQMEVYKPGRGIHGSNVDISYIEKHRPQEFTDNMKILAALLYTFFSYWFKKPEKKRPAYLKGSSDFRVEEFKDGFTIKRACEALRKDKLILKACTINALNDLLKEHNLYKKLIQDREPSVELKKSIAAYEKEKSKLNLTRVNRLAIEEHYPQETPKSRNLEIPAEFEKILKNKSGKPDPAAYAAICLQLVYGEHLKGYTLNPFINISPEEIATDIDPTNFYITYIHEGRTWLKNPNAEVLDKVYNVHLAYLYLVSHTAISAKYKEIFNLMNFLVLTYLRLYSPLFSFDVATWEEYRKYLKSIGISGKYLESVTKPTKSFCPSTFKSPKKL
ncbi:MAG: hypothetical protein ABSA46_08575 [Thermodesulfovibrionales bacterium]